ncbi:hypothetical protein IE53DRAFT_376634 [Violaceomyces palustris]|uniref:Uncharacterized protein n=1 Tax=Violaceomyces palustris TaxID=1673888 RepID=A0ACD0P874_9BASI|nr:hypothetical protein IE53DRAFT_376634 [Violaceomyces palustris]
MGLDLMAEIQVDHNNVKDLYQRFKDAFDRRDEDSMNKIANTIIRETSLHSDAEELSVYKTLERHGLKDVADGDRQEHQEVKELVSKLDYTSISRAGMSTYAEIVDNAMSRFIKHSDLNEDENHKAAEDFLQALKVAPTHSHPSAPQSGGAAQKAAAMALDEGIDETRNFVDLKYVHGVPAS